MFLFLVKKNEQVQSKNDTYDYALMSPFDLTGISLQNNMIVFDDTFVYRRLDNEIIDFNDCLNSDPTIICDEDTGYILFEKLLNHSSLRNQIEEQIQVLENNDNYWDYNDPDDHYIFSDFERTIVNTDLEFGIGSSVYKFLNCNTYIEIIDNPTALNLIRDGNILAGLSSPNVIIYE